MKTKEELKINLKEDKLFWIIIFLLCASILCYKLLNGSWRIFFLIGCLIAFVILTMFKFIK